MRILFIILATLLHLSCEDVVQIDVPESPPRLVIDAFFNIYTRETPLPMIEGGVLLKRSTPFFSEQIPTVSGATVFITNKKTAEIINFGELSNSPGFYASTNVVFAPDFGVDYELTVIYADEVYRSTTRMIPTVPLDKVEQGDRTLFDGDEIEVKITFTDNGDRSDFYFFDFDNNQFLPSQDRFYQGKTFTFSYFYEKLPEIRDVVIKIQGIDINYFTYASILSEQVGNGGGGPFSTPPARVRGNIVNVTNPDNYPLGYFKISESYRVPITLKENENKD